MILSSNVDALLTDEDMFSDTPCDVMGVGVIFSFFFLGADAIDEVGRLLIPCVGQGVSDRSLGFRLEELNDVLSANWTLFTLGKGEDP